MQQLRDYQIDLVDRVKTRLDRGEKVMVQSVTGSGKSVMFGAISANYPRVLLLVHRIELVHQAAKHIQLWCDREVGIIAAGEIYNPNATIQVASIQTICRRNYQSQYDLCIVDEAHHIVAQAYYSVISRLNPSCRLVGFTATPWRLDGSGFANIFDAIEIGESVKKLIKAGYLSKFVLYADPGNNGIEDKQLFSLEKVGNFGGEYSLADLARDNNARDVAAQLYSAWGRYAQDKQTVIFALNIEHSQTIAAYFTWAGVTAAHLDANSPTDERVEMMRKFVAGEIKVLSNVGLFDEGVDIPALECIVMARPTKSLTRFLQMSGRVLRPHPEKEHGIIIDMTGNWLEHGLPDFDRLWNLEGNPPTPRAKVKRNEKDIVEVVIEPELFKPSAKPKVMEQISTDGVWEERLAGLFEKQKAKNYKSGWVIFRLKELNPPLVVWQQAALQLGYKLGWGYFKWRECQSQTVD